MGNEAKHSPEPWRRGEEHETAVELLSAEPHGVICRVTGSILYPRAPEMQANARRIVAAVNAVAGIPTEALEAGALAKALDLWTDYRRLMETEGAVPNELVDLVNESLRALGRLAP